MAQWLKNPQAVKPGSNMPNFNLTDQEIKALAGRPEPGPSQSNRAVTEAGGYHRLGSTFLAGQGFEWRQLIAEGTTVSRNLFGTTFFTLTGFDGFYVLVVLVAWPGPVISKGLNQARWSRLVSTGILSMWSGW